MVDYQELRLCHGGNLSQLPEANAYEDAISVAEEALASGSVRTAKRALVAAERSADASDGPDREKIAALRSRIPK